MKRALSGAAVLGAVIAGPIAFASPASASECSVVAVKSTSGPAWRATCATSAPGTQFRLRTTCYRVTNTNAYYAYGAWATQGSGSSTAVCGGGYSVSNFQLSFR